MTRHLGLLIGVSFCISGCATVARGTNDKMVIDTEPPAAIVTTDKELPKSKSARKRDPSLDPQFYGCPATPCEFKLPRRSEFIMTISKEGFEDVEIGVDYGLHKESLNANLAGSTVTGVGIGLATGTVAAGLMGSGGVAMGTAAATAGVMTAGIGLVSIGIDGATGAMMNVRPNPIFINLPPEGTEFEAHPGVAALREKRQKREEKKRKYNTQKAVPLGSDKKP
ncbi:MAG: hypothetical protein ABJN69_00075 [Hellea sp.]